MLRFFSLFLACLLAPALSAATFVVNTTNVDLPDTNLGQTACDADAVTPGDQCTLRAAVMQANNSAQQDFIILPLDVSIPLTIGGFGGAEAGDLDISAPLVIQGVSLGFPSEFDRLALIQTSIAERIFDIGQAVEVEFRGLRLSGGAPTGLAGTNGGALRITSAGANVLVDRVRFSSNTADNGGAIANAGTLEILESDFTSNLSNGTAAAIHSSGNTTVRRSSIRGIRDAAGVPSAIHVPQGGSLLLENTLIDGAPAAVGATPTGGITADRPASLLIRNSTLVSFTDDGIDVIADGATDLRVYNSIVKNCALLTLAGPPPVLAYDYNMTTVGVCNITGQGNQTSGVLLGPLTGIPGSFVQSRTPPFPSQAIDRGIPPGTPGDPLRQCTSVDQRNQPRPQDGDADGIARCDRGAIEATTLSSSTYVVNLLDQDLVDLVPGDDRCDTQAASGDQCTLRAAVMEANAKPGPDRIEFIVPAGGQSIQLAIAGPGGAHQGDLDITEQLIVDGVGSGLLLTTVSNTVAGERIFDVAVPQAQVARFQDLLLSASSSTGQGGAIRKTGLNTLEIEGMEFRSNTAAEGGAVAVIDGSTIIRDSHFQGNQSTSRGSAILAIGSFDTLVERTSFSANTNQNAADRAVIRVEADSGFRLYNSTLHQNNGGISVAAAGLTQIRSSTITSNGQFGLRLEAAGGNLSAQIRGSALHGHPAGDCMLTATPVTLTSTSNLIGDASCTPAGSNNLSGNVRMAPELTAIDSRVSRVRFPVYNSALIDAISAAACESDDQRGQQRPLDGDDDGNAQCDIGAVEVTSAEGAGPYQFEVGIPALDTDDLLPGDTRCDGSNAPGDQCTLRAAVMEANAMTGGAIVNIPANLNIVLTQPEQAGPPSAAHGDLDITSAVTVRSQVGTAALRPTIQANHGTRIFNVNAPSNIVRLENMRLTGGTTTGFGGAIRVESGINVQIERIEAFANSADQGGGALAVMDGTVVVDRSDFHANGTAALGGTIYNQDDLSLSRSSVRGSLDLSPVGDREAVLLAGGGILGVLNSTVSGNVGDGIRVTDGTLQVENSTIVNHDRAGILFQRITGRTLFIRNSILSGNGQSGCSTQGVGLPTISTDGYNLAQGNGCDIQTGASNVIAVNALLGPLSTTPNEHSFFHSPQFGSPVIDAGHPLVGGLGCIERDQLFNLRPVDGDGNGNARCDIGAVESPTLTETLFANGFE